MTKHISLNLGGAWNSRDVASITNIKPGVLLRSANLAKLSNSGQEKLLELGVTDVIDLRSEREIKQDGIDKLPASINSHFLSIDAGDVSNLKGTLGGSIAESVKMLMSGENAEQFGEDYMTDMYKKMVADPVSAKKFADGLKIIANAKGATLVHCTAGKDRTGVLVALALLILKVDEDLIKEDYMYSNNSVDTLQASIGASNGQSKFIRSMLEVRPRYLSSAWDEAKSHYTNVDDFLNKNNFTEADRQKLRNKFKV